MPSHAVACAVALVVGGAVQQVGREKGDGAGGHWQGDGFCFFDLRPTAVHRSTTLVLGDFARKVAAGHNLQAAIVEIGIL